MSNEAESLIKKVPGKHIESLPTGEIADLADEEAKKVEDLLKDPHNRLLLLSYHHTLKPSIRDGTFNNELGANIWRRLKEETDIPDHWRKIDTEICDTACGVFIMDLRSLNPILQVRIEGNVQNSAGVVAADKDDACSSLERVITLGQSGTTALENVLQTALYNGTTLGFETLASFAHEETHDANGSLISKRVNKGQFKQAGDKGEDEEEKVRRGYSKARQEFIDAEKASESALNNNGKFYFIQEVCSDLSETDVGTHNKTYHSTTKRVLDHGDTYKRIIDSNIPEEDMAKLERKLKALNALGMNGTDLSYALRNAALAEYRELKAQGTVQNMDELITTVYLDKLLDDTLLERYARIKQDDGSSAVDIPKLVDELNTRYETEKKYRFYHQKRIVTEELILELERRRLGTAILVDRNEQGEIKRDTYAITSSEIPPDQIIEFEIYRKHIDGLPDPDQVRVGINLVQIEPIYDDVPYYFASRRELQRPTDPDLIQRLSEQVVSDMMKTPDLVVMLSNAQVGLEFGQGKDLFAYTCFDKLAQEWQHI